MISYVPVQYKDESLKDYTKLQGEDAFLKPNEHEQKLLNLEGYYVARIKVWTPEQTKYYFWETIENNQRFYHFSNLKKEAISFKMIRKIIKQKCENEEKPFTNYKH